MSLEEEKKFSIDETIEILQHINFLEKSINSLEEPSYVIDYRKAQLFQAQGCFEESLVCLQRAITDIEPFKSEFLWKTLYQSIGSLLANTLDYYGKYEEAESLYIKLIEKNPFGDYVADYAIFLHRRKKNYVEAGM